MKNVYICIEAPVTLMQFYSSKEAIFETWLLDGVYYKNGNEYVVLQPNEIKNYIRELVEKEEYEQASKVAEGLKNKICLSEEEVLRSFRVSFPVYLFFVSSALKEELNLGAVIKKYLVNDIPEIIDSLERRNINPEKIEYIKRVYIEWKKRLIDRSYLDKYTLSSTISLDITQEIAKICLDQFMNKVKNECSEVALLLERYLENAKLYNPDNIMYNPNFFELRLSLNEDKKIKVSHIFWNVLRLNTNNEAEFLAIEQELTEDFGREAINKLYEINDGFFLLDGAFFEVELFSGIFEQKEGVVYLDNIIVVNYPDNDKSSKDKPKQNSSDYDQFKNAILKQYDLQINQLKENLEESLIKDKYDEIAEITNELSITQKRRVLSDFSLDILAKLFHRKTQVISIRLPEILFAMWEAKRPNRFESVLKGGVK